MSARYEIKSSTNGGFFWNLKAGNGETILTSEGYSTKSGATNGIESTRANSPHDGQYERKTASDGQRYFVLKARNGEIIGRSEMYRSDAGMENGIHSVKTNGPSATVLDLSGK